jgi:hypothetical protein
LSEQLETIGLTGVPVNRRFQMAALMLTVTSTWINRQSALSRFAILPHIRQSSRLIITDKTRPEHAQTVSIISLKSHHFFITG